MREFLSIVYASFTVEELSLLHLFASLMDEMESAEGTSPFTGQAWW